AEVFVNQTAGSAYPPLPPSGATQAIFLSDFYTDTEELVQRIRTMTVSGIPIHLVQISDPAERLFPFAGRVQFETPNDPASNLQFGDANAIADAYKKQRDAHLGALKDTCRHHGFTYLSHETSEPASNTLAALYHAVEAGREGATSQIMGGVR
ncbi:MAG: hypothetical protein AAF986_05495, partial [Pseudomonadota bacterium]